MSAAPIVFDNGGPLDEGGNEATQWLQADDFTLSVSTILEGGGVYLGFRSGPESGGSRPFTYFGYEDSGGSPGLQLASGAVSTSLAQLTVPWEDDFVYLVTFSFATPLVLEGGAYWLGIHLSEDFQDMTGIDWVAAAPTGGSGQTGRCWTDDPTDTACGIWGDTEREHAFYLEGTAIPEPASRVLLGMGLVTLTVARRKRRLQ